MKKIFKFEFKKGSMILLCVISLFLGISFAKAERPSIHGMLMFGKHSVYLSHLPMFHSPHDYQVIIEVGLTGLNNPLGQYLQDQLVFPQSMYTLVPDMAFVLPEKIQKMESFSATVYRGHFEKNGVPILEKVIIEIKKIIYFKKFSTSEISPSKYEALIFGNQDEVFMAHKISSCPDFDQVVAVELNSKSNLQELLQNNTVFLPEQKNFEALLSGHVYRFAKMGAANEIDSLKTLDFIYTESGDLACHM